MNGLEELILSEHSKAQALLIADIVLKKPELLDELLQHVLVDKEPLSRRASWPLRIVLEKSPVLLENIQEKLVQEITEIKNQAVLRNIIAILKTASIPESQQSLLLNFCTQTLLDSKSEIAVIIHAADLFVTCANKELSLINELLLMLRIAEPNLSGGIKSKIRQIESYQKKLVKTTKHS